jgi:hypothetical protein
MKIGSDGMRVDRYVPNHNERVFLKFKASTE